MEASKLTMEWQQDPTTPERYTLAAGTCQARVWRTARHGWGAAVQHIGVDDAKYGFRSLADAQAWCLAELANLRRQGRCGR